VLRFGVDPGRSPLVGDRRPQSSRFPTGPGRPAPEPGARLAAPSKMDEALRIPAPSPLAETGGLGRFRRGDLIHRLLERLPEIAPADRPDAAVRMLARERGVDDDQRAEMIAAAFGVLDDARFAPVFGPGSRAEVALTGSAPGLNGVSISGRIDRLVITPERVLVVDYKSNRPAPDAVEAADPAYVLQLAVYAAVLKRLYPDRAVEAALVWTDGPKLMPVPAAMMDAALTGANPVELRESPHIILERPTGQATPTGAQAARSRGPSAGAPEEPSMATVKVTDESFDADVLKSSTPVLVDFWAEWCGPCKQIGPALEQIADELGGQVKIAKVNIDDSPMTPSKLGVKGIPTLMLFRDGQLSSLKVGAMPKGKIVEWLAESGIKASTAA
jgi:thioredoxin